MRHTNSNTVFALLFSPHSLIGCFISFAQHGKQLTLHRYERAALDHLELEQGTLFNPTRILSKINSWYPQRMHSIPVVCSIAAPTISEQIIPLPDAHPRLDQFPLSHGPNISWNYTYLYSQDSYHYFYVTGIPRALLFQYQLLSIVGQLPIQTITTQGMALLSLYKYFAGNSYRSSQLAQRMAQSKTIEHLFLKDDLERILSMPNTLTLEHKEIIPLLTACGLVAGTIHETN